MSNKLTSDKEAILMSYEEFGCTPEYWQEYGKMEAEKQIKAYLKAVKSKSAAISEGWIEVKTDFEPVNSTYFFVVKWKNSFVIDSCTGIYLNLNHRKYSHYFVLPNPPKS